MISIKERYKQVYKNLTTCDNCHVLKLLQGRYWQLDDNVELNNIVASQCH